MGEILSARSKEDGKVVFEVLVDYDEALHLKGHMTNVHLFSEDIPTISTRLAPRGKNEATVYFLLPKELRRNLDHRSRASCQKIDTKTKTIFLYIIDKLGLR